MSQVTKRALVASLKRLLARKPLPKITIQDLTEDCGVNRATFYYHFKDIYDLIEWACEEDAQRAVGAHVDDADWDQGFLAIFQALLANKPFVLNVYRHLSLEQVTRYLYRLVYPWIYRVVETGAKGLRVEEADKVFIADFYKYALVGIVLDWIQKDMAPDPYALVSRTSRLLEGEVAHMLAKYQ